MKGNTGSDKQITGLSTVESLSEGAIRKGLRSDAIQNPLTILPLTLSILSVIYLVLYAPVLGGALVAVVLFGLAGVVAGGSFLWRYAFRYNDEYAKKAQEVIALLERGKSEREQAEMKQLIETLKRGFSDNNSDEGLRALDQLIYEYKQLKPVLSHRKETDSLSIAHIPALTEEIYRQGLNVLKNALDLTIAIRSPNKEMLAADVSQLEKEIESLREAGAQAARIKIKEATLVSNKDRLRMVKRQELRIDELLHEADRCEASLHRTRIELAALKADSAEASVNAVTETLRRTINHAKEVQEELKKLGF